MHDLPRRTRVAPAPASAMRTSTESAAASVSSVSRTATRRPMSSSACGVVTMPADDGAQDETRRTPLERRELGHRRAALGAELARLAAAAGGARHRFSERERIHSARDGEDAALEIVIHEAEQRRARVDAHPFAHERPARSHRSRAALTTRAPTGPTTNAPGLVSVHGMKSMQEHDDHGRDARRPAHPPQRLAAGAHGERRCRGTSR